MKNKQLNSNLGYDFSDESLLTLALSHRSVGKNNNERLEFLGDSILSLIITEELYAKFPQVREGELSRLRAHLVKGDTLASIAREFDLGEYLRLGEGELKSGGFRRDSILADTVEAIIGAIYLDADMETCRACVLRWYASRLNCKNLLGTCKDAKSKLQEYLQERKRPLPQYKVIETQGEAHAKQFVVECTISDHATACVAQSSSKRAAEKLAAKKMLQELGLIK